MTALTALALYIAGEAKPLPQGVQDGLDTIRAWAMGIGGGLAVIALLILFIGLFFANQHGQGHQFMQKAGWWLTGAMGLGLAGVIAPIFIAM